MNPYREPGKIDRPDIRSFPRLIHSDGSMRLVQLSEEDFKVEVLQKSTDAMGEPRSFWVELCPIRPDEVGYRERALFFLAKTMANR